MTDYIDREALLKAISKVGGSPLSEWDTVGVVSLVVNQPAADVAPVRRGQWKPAGLTFMGESMDCPECEYRIATSIGRGWNYCPNCGAKMEVEYDERGRD